MSTPPEVRSCHHPKEAVALDADDVAQAANARAGVFAVRGECTGCGATVEVVYDSTRIERL